MKDFRMLRIVPPEPLSSGLTRAQGTRLLTASGEAIPGVTKIVLTCEVDGIWLAQITCQVQPPDVTCLEDVSRRFAPTFWQRCWIGVRRIFERAPATGAGPR